MLADGIYGLTIERCRGRSQHKAVAEAIAVLRNGAILGSGPDGGTFTGVYSVDESGQDRIKIHIDLPPGSELLNGYKSGPQGASIDIETAFERAAAEHRARFTIGGKPLKITAAYLGTLQRP
jgi:hypothetical protein